MILKPLATAADLSETSLENALAELDKTGPFKLFIAPSLMDVGMILRRALHPKLDVYVDDTLPRDAWYVKSLYNGVFSPGP